MTSFYLRTRAFFVRFHLIALDLTALAIVLINFFPGAASAQVLGGDALQTKVRTDLSIFTTWLAQNRARGYIGEVGWPDNSAGDGARWNDLANVWFNDADRAGLTVTAWASGSWWGTSYKLSAYRDTGGAFGLDSANYQASVLESHLSSGSYQRGINVNGAEFGVNSNFSNRNPGIYGHDYIYDPPATFHYLAGRGVKIVRLPFRWERIQSTPSGQLNQTELNLLTTAINNAGNEGLKVIIDMQNFGSYSLDNGSGPSVQPIGGGQISDADFANVWSQLSMALKGNGNVYAYDLMNEPHDLPGSDGQGGAHTWEVASQSAVTAIRNDGDAKLIMVPGYAYSSVQSWAQTHSRSWINDPANNFAYEAHQYFDRDNTGTYTHTYAQELAYEQSAGYTAAPPTAPPSAPTATTPTGSSTSAPGPTSGASGTASMASSASKTATHAAGSSNTSSAQSSLTTAPAAISVATLGSGLKDSISLIAKGPGNHQGGAYVRSLLLLVGLISGLALIIAETVVAVKTHRFMRLSRHIFPRPSH